MRLLLLAALLTGCATFAGASDVMTVIPYPWGDVTIAPQKLLDAHCIERDEQGRIVGNLDSGEPIKEGQEMCGCAQQLVRDGNFYCDMWLSIDCPEEWPHEESHCHGVKDPENMGYSWPKIEKAEVKDYPTFLHPHWGGQR